MPGPVVMTSPAPPPPPSVPALGVGPGTAAGFPVTTLSPVDRLDRRLRALSPDNPQLYAITDLSGPAAHEPAWIPISRALPAMVASAGDHLAISPAVAGARMVGTLGYAVAGRLAAALAVAGQAYDTGPQSLLVRLDDQGLVERIGVLDPALALPAASPVPAGGAVVRLADLDAVIGWAADRVWASLEPLIDELHEMTRYGVMPMWNLVADAVLGPATVAPRLAGLDQRAGRAAGSALLDALVVRGAPIHRRGTLHPDRPVLTPVRGSCCLHFRQTQEKCDTCPLSR